MIHSCKTFTPIFFPRILLSSLGITLLLLGDCSQLFSQTADQKFLDGLRQRRLFSLAEAHCQDELKKSELSEQARLFLVLELSRVYVEQARNTSAQDREVFWNKASQVVEDWLARGAEQPGAPLAQVQQGLVLLARGELARQEAEVTAASEKPLAEAREFLRLAIRELESAGENITQLRRNPPSSPSLNPDNVFGAEELASMERNVSYQLGRALRNQGETYPPGSPDRSNSLQKSIQWLSRLIDLEALEPLVWQSRLDEAACWRLLGNTAKAGERLNHWLSQSPPDWVKAAAQGEKIRLALADGKIDQALNEASEEIKALAPERDLALVETALAAWRQARENKQNDEAQRLQSEAAQLIRRIDQLHGSYWSRRAETMLAATVSQTGGGSDLEVLLRAAESFFRGGQPNEALKTYDRLRIEAEKAKQLDMAFQAGFTAAAIEKHRGASLEAARRFHELALVFPEHPRAAEAHLAGIEILLTPIPNSNPATTKESNDLGAIWLEEHLKLWPKGNKTDLVRYWLGRWRQTQGKLDEAIKIYQEISPQYLQYHSVVRALGECHVRELAAMEAAGSLTPQQVETAARFHEQLIIGPSAKIPERFSPVEQEAALASARLWMHPRLKQFDRAERILSAALSGSPEAELTWRISAQSMLVFSFAGQGRNADGEKVLREISAESPNALLELVQKLGALQSTATDTERRQLAQVTLQAIQLLESANPKVSTDDLLLIQVEKSRALAAIGRFPEGRELLSLLAQKNPRSGNIQEALAQLLLNGPDAENRHQGLSKYREVEKSSRPTSPRWFRARYAIAWGEAQLGNQTKAAQLIQVTKRLYPELGTAEQKSRFLALEKACLEKGAIPPLFLGSEP